MSIRKLGWGEGPPGGRGGRGLDRLQWAYRGLLAVLRVVHNRFLGSVLLPILRLGSLNSVARLENAGHSGHCFVGGAQPPI